MLDKNHIFISYSSRNKDFVDALRNDLQKANLNVWIDKEGLTAGTPNWEKALRQSIRGAYALVLVASPDSYESRYVQGELEVARMYDCPLFSVWADGENWGECVPLELIKMQYVNMRGSSYRAGLDQLVHELKKMTPAPLTSESPQELFGIVSHPINFEPRNPYKGLRAFTEHDKDDYFGRDALISELVEILRSTNFLAVVGPSGSGKSSLVMAGLLPRLNAGSLPNSEAWLYLDPVLPGTDPVESLAIVLANALGSSIKSVIDDLDHSNRGLHLTLRRLAKQRDVKVVLLIDQFEELFTQTTSDDKRNQFIELLVNAATEPNGQALIIITLRADFYDRPMNYERLGKLIEQHSKSLLPMTLDDLRRVIEAPVQKQDVQVQFEPNLVGDLLYEVSGESGALPLLQFTLDQLFRLRKGQLITLEAYHGIGGVRGALASHAEKTYLGLPSEEHRSMARSLFLRLIELGTTEQDTTRRRTKLSQLILVDDKQTHILAETSEQFINARLLTVKEQTIEISHEALIREWERLSSWLSSHRDDIRIQHSLSRDVNEWLQRKQSLDMLYRGERLAEARSWATRNNPSLDENTFIAASFQAEIDELENARIQEEVNKRLDALRTNVMTSFPREMRTPVSIILGFSEMILEELAEGEITLETIEEYVRPIHQAVYKLERIIDKFLKFVWIATTETDSIAREKLKSSKCFNLMGVIESEARRVSNEHMRDGDLNLAFADIGSANIDEDNLRTIVYELVDNAFKFSQPGQKVDISVEPDGNHLTLAIRDGGRGMAIEHIEHQGLYMQFERWLYEQQGMGLGLTIARRLTELYGGTFRIESEIGEYTKVIITIPC